MENEKLLRLILDSWNKPLVFVDSDHIIRYINAAAKVKHEQKWGDILGKSIFDCHNEKSRKIIEEAVEEFKNGKDEIQIVNSPKHRVYISCVRDENGQFIGYYERYDPPEGR